MRRLLATRTAHDKKVRSPAARAISLFVHLFGPRVGAGQARAHPFPRQRDGSLDDSRPRFAAAVAGEIPRMQLGHAESDLRGRAIDKHTLRDRDKEEEIRSSQGA